MVDEWAALNDRQRAYLQAIYATDQEAEAEARAAWSLRAPRRPAAEWRWLRYATLADGPSPLKGRLRRAGLIDAGTGSTFEALERRGYIQCRHGVDVRGEPVVDVQLTRPGRRLVRAATSVRPELRLPKGTLREWHWRALARAYVAGAAGSPSEGAGTYARIGWTTWRRLLDYHPRALVETAWGRDPADGPWDSRLYITPAGRSYYEQQWGRYRDLYPAVEAPEPEHGL